LVSTQVLKSHTVSQRSHDAADQFHFGRFAETDDCRRPFELWMCLKASSHMLCRGYETQGFRRKSIRSCLRDPKKPFGLAQVILVNCRDECSEQPIHPLVVSVGSNFDFVKRKQPTVASVTKAT